MGVEFFSNWGTCMQLRGLMDERTSTAWTLRIRSAKPDELRQIAAELLALTGYSGKMRYKPWLTAAGQRQAEIFLEEILRELFTQNFILPLREFNFPYANNAATAKRVVEVVGTEIKDLYKQNPRVALEERRKVLNVALRNRFDGELKEIYAGKGLEGQVRRLFEEKTRVLPTGIQNIFLLKLLEMIEVERGPIDPLERALGGGGRLTYEQSRTRSRLEKLVHSVLEYLPAERLAGLSAEQAKAAMFFVFRFGEDELNASQSRYVFTLIKIHPNPDELVREYLSLDRRERHNLFALRDLTPRDQSWLCSTDSRGWAYDDQLVITAIELEYVKNFRDVIRQGQAGRFFNQQSGPRFVHCYRPPK